MVEVSVELHALVALSLATDFFCCIEFVRSYTEVIFGISLVIGNRTRIYFAVIKWRLNSIRHFLRHRMVSCDIRSPFLTSWGTRYRSWLRQYATSRKVAGSSPDEMDFFFNLPNPSNRTMALGSTQPLTKISTRNLPGG
jgi:hypothetical protein